MKFNIFNFTQRNSIEKNQSSKKYSKELIKEAGIILKERREEYGISRKELAIKTRITPSVLEAIENGLIEKLPESAYLSSMLNIIEIELNLKKDTLSSAIKVKTKASIKRKKNNSNPRSIDIFGTWGSSLIYVLIMFSSIIVLNHQQRKLARLNSQTYNPIYPRSNIEMISKKEITAASEIKRSKNRFNIDKKNELNQFRKLFSIFKKKENLGLLEINLKNPKTLTIESIGKYTALMEEVNGSIKLNLPSPILIQIDPPPDSNDEIIWKGTNYTTEEIKDGIYILDEESNNPISGGNDLPQ